MKREKKKKKKKVMKGTVIMLDLKEGIMSKVGINRVMID